MALVLTYYSVSPSVCHRQPDLHLLWSLWLKLSFPLSPHLVFIGWFLLSCSTPLPYRWSSLSSSSVPSIWLVTSSTSSWMFSAAVFCYLMIIYLIFSPCPHFSHWLSVSPQYHKKSLLTSLPRAGSLTPTTSRSLDIWLLFHCYVNITASESFLHFKHLLRPSYFIQYSQNAVSWTNFLLNTESSLQNNWMSNISLHWTWAEPWPFLYSPRKYKL